MNLGFRNQILEKCKRFKVEQLIECADVNYKDQDWDLQSIDEFSINNLILVVTRLFVQIEEGLKGEDFVIFPVAYNPNSIGDSLIITEMDNLLNGIEQKRPFPEFIRSIRWLTQYLVENDLWNKERTTLNIIDIEKLQTRLLTLNNQIHNEFENLAKLKENLLDEKKTITAERELLNQFIEQKRIELQSVSDSVPTVTNQKAEVDSVLKNVQQIDSDIRSVQKNHHELYEQLKSQIENQDKEFKDAVNKIIEEKDKLTIVIENGDKQIAYFKSLEDFIKAKEAEIIKLGGLAAGAALGGTFGLRQNELAKSRLFWRWAVPTITILAMIWVIIVFTCLKAEKEQLIINTILNLVKTIPAFVLMGFVFKQYSKERNLEEEYAFKAAVANTITAYSDILKGEDKDENKSRQAMLNDSVKQVQTPPKLYIESSGKFFSFRTKGLPEAIKSLSEAIANIKK